MENFIWLLFNFFYFFHLFTLLSALYSLVEGKYPFTLYLCLSGFMQDAWGYSSSLKARGWKNPECPLNNIYPTTTSTIKYIKRNKTCNGEMKKGWKKLTACSMTRCMTDRTLNIVSILFEEFKCLELDNKIFIFKSFTCKFVTLIELIFLFHFNKFFKIIISKFLKSFHYYLKLTDW